MSIKIKSFDKKDVSGEAQGTLDYLPERVLLKKIKKDYNIYPV
jgi:hypothetical protein